MYKVLLKKNMKYSICSCGLSKILPYCDNAHRLFNKQNKTNYKSIKIISSKDVELEITSSTWIKND